MASPITSSDQQFGAREAAARMVLHLLATLVLIAMNTAVQAWPVIVCGIPNMPQQAPAVAPNAFGGAYVAYVGDLDPEPSTAGSAFGKHLSHAGESMPSSDCGDTLFSPLPVNGFGVAELRVCADGQGGVFVAAQKAHGSSTGVDIYVQHVSAAGTNLWGADGVPACSATNLQLLCVTSSPAVCSDNNNGCYITWQDRRNQASTGYDVYVQHLDASGAPWSFEWPADGLQLTSLAGEEVQATVVADDSGGAYVAWQGPQISSFTKVHLTRVYPDGTIAPVWQANGNVVCTFASNQIEPVAASDRAGGVIIAWTDGRANDIYATRVGRNGGLAAGWSANGVALTQATLTQDHPAIATTASGDAVVAWMDARTVANGPDIYAQRVSIGGTVLWTADGVPVATAAASQAFPKLVVGTGGSAIIVWDDKRNNAATSDDIYTQALDANGDALWPTDGVMIGGGPGSQIEPQLASDGDGGAVIAWRDNNNDANGDVVAAHIYSNGNVGVPPSRESQTTLAMYPNPAAGSVTIVVPSRDGAASLEFLDVAGRVVRHFARIETGQGSKLVWDLLNDDGNRVPAGVYWARARSGGTISFGALFVTSRP